MFYNYNNTWWLLTQSSFDLSIIKYHYDKTNDKSKDNFKDMHACIHPYTYIHYVTYVGPYFATPTAPRSLGRVCVSFMVGLVDGLVPMTNLYEDRFPTKKIWSFFPLNTIIYI